ncbi:hypothetical protein GGTG_00537 [Gaeumannomyces tritici R3-111a-1]|uniref:Uncharacterized protein n=1 Tax=Gaeumannomyces tritici (strain R3-111a-1) TaxID=644352 RepID=J3NH01_GAET3|nr:hypothetical protein GGTG_00537 [Gaeumannomyces tritici R3-111a-1]EJT80541.1 hypothetical protein GGTG_00537 [Gaeumannomyces tritici R3-111a-1]
MRTGQLGRGAFVTASLANDEPLKQPTVDSGLFRAKQRVWATSLLERGFGTLLQGTSRSWFWMWCSTSRLAIAARRSWCTRNGGHYGTTSLGATTGCCCLYTCEAA